MNIWPMVGKLFRFYSLFSVLLLVLLLFLFYFYFQKNNKAKMFENIMDIGSAYLFYYIVEE